MAKGQSQPTQTTQQVLSPEQRELLNLAMPGARQFAAQTLTPYPGTTVAAPTSAQTTGQSMALSAAGGAQQSLADSATNANNFLLTDIWNPATNPALQGAVNAAVRPITEQYQQVVQPRTRDDFLGAGQQFGGSRRAVAENMDANSYLRAVGDTSSRLVQDQYANNLQAYTRALGLVPQTQQAAVQPAITTSGVGDVQQAYQQQLLNEQLQNYYFQQYAPFLQSRDLVSLVQGIPGGSTVSTGNVPKANPYTSALGGAASGAALGSAILPGVGTGVGAGIGALLSFL